MAFQELADGTQSKQKAEYVSHTLLTRKSKNDYLELKYKRLDGPTPGQEATTGAFITTLAEAAKTLIKAGGEFVVVKTKAGKFWNLTDVLDVSTYVEKPKSTYNGGGGVFKSNSGNSSYDTTGVKVGAARNQAIAFLAATKGTKFTLDDVDSIAYEIVTRQAAQEDNVRAGKNVTTNVAKEDDSLSSIDF